MIRVLIADDSPTARALLRAILDAQPDLRVVGEAVNGNEAVASTEALRPDVVLMDVHMPELDGIEATREIMARRATPIVVVSSVSQRDVDLSLQATEAGALVALPKPEGPSSPRFREQSDQIVSMVRAMAGVKVVRRWSLEKRAPQHRVGTSQARDVRVVGIAASTGGPPALRALLSELPSDFPAPIVIVQHIARDFTAGFAHWLGDGSPLPVRLAQRGEPLRPAHVYVAPDDVHLRVGQDLSVNFSSAPPLNGFRPSATHLFESIAAAHGARGLGVVLTGMGSDGADGLAALRAAGGYVIGQDEGSSVVFGMAQEALRRGGVDELLPMERIASRIVTLVGQGASHV